MPDTISLYDLAIVDFISQFQDGASAEMLTSKFGNESALAIARLMESGYIFNNSHTTPFFAPDQRTPENWNYHLGENGKLILKIHRFTGSLSRKKQIKERFLGFVLGVFSSVLVGIIANLLS